MISFPCSTPDSKNAIDTNGPRRCGIGHFSPVSPTPDWSTSQKLSTGTPDYPYIGKYSSGSFAFTLQHCWAFEVPNTEFPPPHIQIPTHDVHLQFEKWARQYGPVYSLILGTKTMIVLSSDAAVKSLLDKKSGIYSDRQEMYVGQGLASGGLRLLMMVSITTP